MVTELPLEAFGKGKVYPRRVDGWCRLACKRFADGIIEHSAKLRQGWRHDCGLGIQHLYSVFLCAEEIADIVDVDCDGLLDRCDGLHLFLDERNVFFCNPADKEQSAMKELFVLAVGQEKFLDVFGHLFHI